MQAAGMEAPVPQDRSKMPLVIGQERVATKATTVEAEARIKIAGRISGPVVIAKIIVVVVRPDE